MKRFVKGNPNLCIGCRTCMIACVVAHEGKQIFEIDPDSYDFHPRIQVVKTTDKTLTVQCHHCENAPCAKACPVGAIQINTHSIDLNPSKCIGCRQCVFACPFGAIQMVEEKFSNLDGSRRITAHKCDLCQDTGASPACVAVCPTDALTYYTEENFVSLVESKNANTAKVAIDAAQEG